MSNIDTKDLPLIDRLREGKEDFMSRTVSLPRHINIKLSADDIL